MCFILVGTVKTFQLQTNNFISFYFYTKSQIVINKQYCINAMGAKGGDDATEADLEISGEMT